MTNLPKPSFSTEEEILAGGQAMADTDDTTTNALEKAVPLGEVIADNDMCHVRFLRKDDALIYHIFRGEGISDDFWGTGEFGLVLLAAAEGIWYTDKPRVEFVVDTCRPEVQEDDPTETPKYPKHYYGAYSVIIRGLDRKMFLREEKISNLSELLEHELRKSLDQWSSQS